MSHKQILLIDDEKQLNKVVQMCLSKLGGWTLFVAESGTEGLQLAESQQPDAILLDVMMPDMDGLSVLQHLRENPVTQTIPVIMFTAKLPSLIQEQYAPWGIAGVISKPFDPLQLVHQVSDALGWQ